MINDFHLLGIFIPNYTTNIVVNTIKERLLNYTKDNDKLEFLNAVLNLHMDKNYNSADDLIIKRANYSNHPVILAQLDAYYPIKDWIEERCDEIEKAIKKDQSNKEKKQLLEAAQTTFEIREKYRSLLPDMWRLMKDHKSHMIAYDTKFDDFEKVFLEVEEKDIINPIRWLGCKSTLLRLFYELIENKILTPKTINKNSNKKFTHPHDICFVDDNNGKKFPKWRSTFYHFVGTKYVIGRKTTNMKTIDKIINLFKADNKID